MSEAGATSSYRPGDWLAVVGARAMVVLPPDAKARVARVWELSDEGADFDELLDALIAGGLRDLSAFALVSIGEEPTRVLVRGELTVQLQLEGGDQAVVDGRPAATWVERTLSHVSAVRIEAGQGGGPELPLVAGLVRVSRLEHPAVSAEVRPPPPPAEPVTDATTEVFPTTPPPSGPPPPLPPTGAPPTSPPPTSPPLPPTGPPPTSPPPSETPAGATGAARLLFSHGESVEVDRRVVVGRAPNGERFGPPEESRLVTVPSPNQEISATHLEVRPGHDEEGPLVVADLGSTNGTALTLPGQPTQELEPGVPVALVPGAIIDLGDGSTIQVVTP